MAAVVEGGHKSADSCIIEKLRVGMMGLVCVGRLLRVVILS